MCSVPAQNIPSGGVTCTQWDGFEECIWNGTESGAISCFLNPNMERVCSFPAHPAPARAMLISSENILSISESYFRIHSRGGVVRLSVSGSTNEVISGLRCMEWAAQVHNSSSQVVLGGDGDKLLALDLATGQVLNEYECSGGANVIKASRGYLACGGIDGKIVVRDVHSIKIEHTVEAFNGPVMSIAQKGDLLVCCGLAQRHGQYYVDHYVKVPAYSSP